MVERFLAKEEVAGSIPVARSKRFVTWYTQLAPEWRNGIRKGLKIPRPQGIESSSLSSGTNCVDYNLPVRPGRKNPLAERPYRFESD